MPSFIRGDTDDQLVRLGDGAIFDRFKVDFTEPTPENTGPRFTPSIPVSGEITLATGQIYSGRHVSGRITIPQSATGTIIIEDCIIDVRSLAASSSNIISVHPKTGASVIIRFNEIIGKEGWCGIGTRGFTAYRNNIHHVDDCVRLNSFNASVMDLAAEVYSNFLGPHLLITPDQFNTRTDLKNHCDGIQHEGGENANIHGNTFWSYTTKDGTSNVDWVLSSAPYTPQPIGTEGARDHPQALSGFMLTPSVSPALNTRLINNWFYGGEIQVSCGSSDNSTSTGVIAGNRHSRDQWHALHTVDIDATGVGLITPAAGSPNANVYMDDKSSVNVRRNA